MLEQGEFDVFVSDPAEGRKHIHTYVAAPDEARYPCFGELALMYAKPRQASVAAQRPGSGGLHTAAVVQLACRRCAPVSLSRRSLSDSR